MQLDHELFIRKGAVLVRRPDGRARFELDPRYCHISIFDMLEPHEQDAILEARRVLPEIPEPNGSNINDIRHLLPDTLPEPQRSVLVRFQEIFPLSTDLES